jgi:tyrosinase
MHTHVTLMCIANMHDLFACILVKPGANFITRNSRQSAVTIPFEQTFRDLERGRSALNSSGAVQDDFNFCGCGWPHHMLIPKGSPEGYPSVLFVMVSNLDTDWVSFTISVRFWHYFRV